MARIALVFALCLAFGARAFAGGGSFGNDEDADNNSGGPLFFGFVKDKDGAALEDAKITVTVKNLNSSMILRSDSQGHFFLRGFDKSIDPDDVQVTCSKDGYKELAHTRKPALSADAPVEVDCVLEHQ